MYYICKQCGRSMRSDEEIPIYCYFDRMDTIENISDEDAKKMGLTEGRNINFEGIETFIEFPGDVKFDPFNGKRVETFWGGYFTLSNFQDQIMEMVRG